MKSLIAAAILVACGDPCHVQKVQRVQVVQQQPQVIIQRQPVIIQRLAFDHYYRVGATADATLLADAIAERLAKRLEAPSTSEQEAGTEASASISSAQQLINDNCLKCHDGSKPDQPNLSDISAVDDATKLNISRAVYSGTMPPNGPALTDEQMSVLVDWLLRHKEPEQ